MKKYRFQLSLTLVGAFLGYLLAHPYTMFIYLWAHEHQVGVDRLSFPKLFATALTSFQPAMLPMAFSFALMGAIVGFLAGTVMDKRKQLHDTERESERRKIAFDTLHQVMVTLSHHLLNADTIIAGVVRHCKRKQGLDKDILEGLETINEQARKIEAVVRALQKVKEIRTAQYTNDSTVLMMDVTQEMEEALKGPMPEQSRDKE